MIKLDFYGDEDLSLSVKRVISSLLPHDNFKPEFFTTGLTGLTGLIQPKEMPLEFWLISEVLSQINKIKVTVPNYQPRLERESFQHILSSNLEEFVNNNTREVQQWAEYNSMDLNYSIPEQVQNVQIALYNSTVDLYDSCFSLAISSDQIPMLLMSLQGNFKANAVRENLKAQYEIMDRGAWIGRKKYLGADDCLEYMSEFSTEFKTRLLEVNDSESIVVDDPSKMAEINKLNVTQSQVIAKWGIPELDDYTPVLRNRLVVVAANPNEGKTSYMSNRMSRWIFEDNARVAYITGEATVNKVKNAVSSNHIYREYHKFVSPNQIMGIEDSMEESKRLINISDMDIVNSKNMILNTSITYDHFYEEAKKLYDKSKFDILIIDHTGSMRSSSDSKLFTAKQKIDEMIYQARQFKNDYPVCIIFLSHLSVEAQQDLKKFDKVYSIPTWMSGDPNKEADEVFILHSNETLQASNLKALQVYKRRGAEKLKQDVILKIRSSVCDAEYLPELQSQSSKLDKDEALNKVNKLIDAGSPSDDLDLGMSINLLDDDDD